MTVGKVSRREITVGEVLSFREEAWTLGSLSEGAGSGEGGAEPCQSFQHSIPTFLDKWVMVQVWLLPVGIGQHGDGESEVSGLMLSRRYR